MNYNYSKKSIWKWILIYLVIGIIVYSLVYYFFFYKKGGYSYNPQNYQNNYQNQTQNSTEIANWKTYKNEQYGFEFEYPSKKVHPILGYSVNTINILKEPKDSMNSGDTCYTSTKALIPCRIFAEQIHKDDLYYGITVEFIKAYVDVEDHLSESQIHKYDVLTANGHLDVTEKKLIGGKDGYEYNYITSTNYAGHGFMIPLENGYLEVGEKTKSPYMITDDSDWNRIISTFKFTK